MTCGVAVDAVAGVAQKRNVTAAADAAADAAAAAITSAVAITMQP